MTYLFRVFDSKFKRMSLPFNFKDIADKTGVEFRDNMGWYSLTWERIETEPNRFIIMQFTGLKDKQGKMIFEGDKLRLNFKPDSDECVYEEEGYEVKFVDGSFCVKDHKNGWWAIRGRTNWFENIGNVYQEAL
jgi:uncharacterized phage protein (TIGR01671 family)